MKNLKNKSKTGAFSVEVGIMTSLVVVTAFIVCGVFFDNIKSAVESGNIAQLWNNSGKTSYQAYDTRDYSTSAMYVQVMGEQGLKSLRQKANNTLIKILPELSASSNDKQLAGTAEYLGLIISNIMGTPNVATVCSYMTKPAQKETCEQLGLNKVYTLTVNNETQIIVNGVAFTLEKKLDDYLTLVNAVIEKYQSQAAKIAAGADYTNRIEQTSESEIANLDDVKKKLISDLSVQMNKNFHDCFTGDHVIGLYPPKDDEDRADYCKGVDLGEMKGWPIKFCSGCNELHVTGKDGKPILTGPIYGSWNDSAEYIELINKQPNIDKLRESKDKGVKVKKGSDDKVSLNDIFGGMDRTNTMNEIWNKNTNLQVVLGNSHKAVHK